MTENADPKNGHANGVRGFWTERRISLIVVVFFVLFGAFASVEVSRLVQSRDNGSVLRIIRDSVDPGGTRYERNQKASAEIIGSLNDTTIIAVYCGRLGGDVPTMRSCVAEQYVLLHPGATTTTTDAP